jgi:predicted metal-dependent hydrolase
MNDITIDINGFNIVIKSRVSSRATRIGLRANVKGDVELVLPVNARPEAGRQFIISNLEWIRARLKDSRSTPEKLESIPIFGKDYKIKYTNDSANISIKLHKDYLEICASGADSELLIINFLKQHILEKITNLTKVMSDNHNLHYSDIGIMSATTRWGSCSGDKSLRFNWRLVFVHEDIIESIVAHELAHTKIMNHSSSFWELVYKLCPHTPVANMWLKENGRAIHQILSKYK